LDAIIFKKLISFPPPLAPLTPAADDQRSVKVHSLPSTLRYSPHSSSALHHANSCGILAKIKARTKQRVGPRRDSERKNQATLAAFFPLLCDQNKFEQPKKGYVNQGPRPMRLEQRVETLRQSPRLAQP